jgi:hypothetical protein
MTTPDERELNQTAYRRLKEEIDRTYPRGRFVALAGGRIVGDAAGFKELDAVLDAEGLDSPDVLVVQSGADYPESSVIVLHGLRLTLNNSTPCEQWTGCAGQVSLIADG